MGGFPEIEEDIDQNELLEELADITDIYDYGTIVNGMMKGKISPLGLFTIQLEGCVAYPHVRWFPWASPRNKIEATIAFLRILVKDYTTVVYSQQKDKPFFVHLCKYGILHHVGVIHRFYEDGGKNHIFQARKV